MPSPGAVLFAYKLPGFQAIGEEIQVSALTTLRSQPTPWSVFIRGSGIAEHGNMHLHIRDGHLVAIPANAEVKMSPLVSSEPMTLIATNLTPTHRE